MEMPQFKPDVPRPLLITASEADRWMYEQQSIQRQQNNFIIEQLQQGQDRFAHMDKQRTQIELDVKAVQDALRPITEFKARLTAKWTVVVFLLSAILGPVALAVFGAACTRWFEKLWK